MTRAPATAKLNLALVVGPLREDGRHEVATVLQRIDLADRVSIEHAAELRVEGFAEDTLVRAALERLAEAASTEPRWHARIWKQVPVAAGLGGGSADAAAILRLAAGEVDGLEALAAQLGADVPSQLRPALSLVGGAGERVEPLPQPKSHAVVLLPDGGGLSTADVFAAADQLGHGRAPEELEEIAAELRRAAGSGASPLSYAHLLKNDLELAAVSLRPSILTSLEALTEAGAPVAVLSGSGPTAAGIFESVGAARAAAERLDRDDAIVCEAGLAP